MIKRSSLSTLAISSILLLFVIATGAQTEYDYITSGNAALDAKNYDQAITYYNSAISVNPSSTVGYYNRGLAYDKSEITIRRSQTIAVRSNSTPITPRLGEIAVQSMKPKGTMTKRSQIVRGLFSWIRICHTPTMPGEWPTTARRTIHNR
ncbi:MAG: tetratricopeptide repeat protein [Chloracidobacterium sp.]|nr:tetratricopeptide repeat protein [Chloracidobacterium sp.]